MIRQLYSMYDNKANEMIGPVMVLGNAEVAIRQYKDILAETKPIADHADDYDMWYLGNFDTETGTINSEPRLLINGKDYNENNKLQLAK